MAKTEKHINTDETDMMEEFIGEPVTETRKFEKKEADPTREGQILDVMNAHNLGNSLFRLIPDTVKVKGPDGRMLTRLYRKINNAFTVKVKGKDDRFPVQYQLPSANDFTYTGGLTLTTGQISLLEATRDAANNISKFLTYDTRRKFQSLSEIIPVCQYNKQIVLVYGKLLKYVDPQGKLSHKEELGKVRVFKFAKGKVGSNDFITMFQTAKSMKAAILGSSSTWQREWFARQTGQMDKAVSVTVSRAKDSFGTYTLGVSLETIAPFELTEHDLEVADNLNSRAFDVTTFDSDMFEACLEKLNYVQEQINHLGNQTAPNPGSQQEYVEEADIISSESAVGGFEDNPF